MKKSVLTLRSVLVVAVGVVLLTLGLGSCKSTDNGNPDRASPTPAPGAPGPHNGGRGAADYKDAPLRAPGPRN